MQTLVEHANQAAQRARWASNTMLAYQPPPSVGQGWISNMKNLGKQAADAAEQAAKQCERQAKGNDNDDEEEEDGPGDKRGKVPCKFFLLGRCWQGSGCEFAHEMPELKPRPIMLKREKECMYFERGKCTRGVACPFAHGAEELAEISRYVATLKKEKQQFARFRRG